MESSGDYCMCQRRTCDRPAPANGGAACDGSGLVVTNCTRHGLWSRWSAWSGCSQTCGVGLKTRRRHCGNPEPAFGGRVCIGRDAEDQYCHDLPACRPGEGEEGGREVGPAGGGGGGGRWSQWSDWTACSSRCGAGWRSRARKCYDTEAGGCEGCDKDWEECSSPACSDYVDVTDYTPWVTVTDNSTTAVGGGGGAAGWFEKRFTFSYRAPLSINKVTKIRQYINKNPPPQ